MGSAGSSSGGSQSAFSAAFQQILLFFNKVLKSCNSLQQTLRVRRGVHCLPGGLGLPTVRGARQEDSVKLSLVGWGLV
jgi:hypothetical protein